MSRSNQDSPTTLRILSVCLDVASLGALQQGLKALPAVMFSGNLSQYLGERRDLSLLQRFTEPLPDIVLVDFDQDRQKAAATAEYLQSALQGRASIFAVSSLSQPELIINAMQAGCSEYLAKPFAHERLSQAIAKVEIRKREKERIRKRGKIFTMLGAKGGAGVTTVATHFATFLAKKSGRKTLLVDQHPDLGDVALYLGLEKHAYHFYELANNVHRLDSNLLQGFVVRHASGLDVLPSPDALDAVVNVSEQDVEITLDFLKTIYDYVVIDCPPGLSGLNVAAMQKSDEMWLVATPDVPSVRNLSRYHEHLIRFNHPPDAVKALINRHSKKDPVTKEDVAKALKRPVSMTLPNCYADVMEAVNTGTPISPESRSEFASAMRQWVDSVLRGVSPAAALQEPKRRFGILGL